MSRAEKPCSRMMRIANAVAVKLVGSYSLIGRIPHPSTKFVQNNARNRVVIREDEPLTRADASAWVARQLVAPHEIVSDDLPRLVCER